MGIKESFAEMDSKMVMVDARLELDGCVVSIVACKQNKYCADLNSPTLDHCKHLEYLRYHCGNVQSVSVMCKHKEATP